MLQLLFPPSLKLRRASKKGSRKGEQFFTKKQKQGSTFRGELNPVLKKYLTFDLTKQHLQYKIYSGLCYL